MSRLLIALACVLYAAVAFAQTANPLSSFVFEQDAADLATAQSYVYRLYFDGATTSTVAVVKCAGEASPFTCTTPVGKFAIGAHTVTATATSPDGIMSDKSVVLSFTMIIVSAPRNLRIQ